MPANEIKSDVQTSKASLLATVKNNKVINRHHKLTQDFFGFDMNKTSRKNLKTMRGLLAQKAASLSEEEMILFSALNGSYTLKHATNAGMEIMNSGQIQSIRGLEAKGLDPSRHTPHSSAQDLSVFFVLGIGNHKTPAFTEEASYLITIDLEKMQQKDPAALKRLWVGGHLTEYQKERKHTIKLGNVIFTIEHSKERTKVYRFTDAKGVVTEWKLRYEDEIFSGNDVVPGITLQFLYMLRLLGGKNNPLINKLYTAAIGNTPSFMPLLEKVFSNVMIGWIYPEAKMIDVLNIDPSYADVTETKRSVYESIKQDAVLEAIEQGDSRLLLTLFNKKYTYKDSKALEEAMDIQDESIRFDIIKLLVEHGANPIRDAHRDENCLLHKIAEKGTAQELDFLLSQEYPDADEPLIKQLPNPNLSCKQEYYDLVDLVCKTDYSGEKLAVLKKHQADFVTMGSTYVKSALSAYEGYSPSPNLRAIAFLANEGVLLKDKDLNNKTPLMLACQSGDKALVRFLVEKMQADVNQRLRFYAFSLLAMKEFEDDPSSGMTALHYAASYGHKDIVEYLLSKGANPHLKTEGGEFAVDLVDAANHELRTLLQSQPMTPALPELKKEKAPVPVKLSKKEKVAVLVMGKRKDGKSYIVLGKPRSQNSKRDYYCFPGGSADKKDSSLEAAAMRELLEETGIDIHKFPNSIIQKIGSFQGFNSEDHHSTSFFLVDVGTAPLEVHPCDDLVDARRVLVEQLIIDEKQSIAKLMRYGNALVLGSNALIIQCALSQGFTEDSLERIQEQLLIEADGYRLLMNAIPKFELESFDLKPIVHLLENNAHLSHNPYEFRQSLAIEMAKINSMTGIQLLHDYGVDITETADIKVLDRKGHGSVMLYAILCEDLTMMQSLALLTKEFFKSYHYNIVMMTEAAKCDSCEILHFLLDQGLNPNGSFEYDRRGTLIYPIVSMAIKQYNLSMVRELMADERLFLNRERSPMDRDPVLLNALNHQQFIAARYLMASCRLDLSVKSAPESSSKKAQTAWEFAQENHCEIAELIAFHSNYTDMNDFLRKKGYPEMDGFKHVLCSDGKTTIYFISNSLEKLQIFNLMNHFKFDIHKMDNQYYCRLGIRRLTSLMGGAVLAGYLLEFTQDSMFWGVREDSHRNLHKALVENTVKTLNADTIGLSEQRYSEAFYFKFYRQLIRENFSLEEVEIDCSSKHQIALDLILSGIENHDKISRIKLTNSFQNASKAIWDKAMPCSLSLKNMKDLQCFNIPVAYLLELLEQVSQKWNKGDCKLKIEGEYSAQEYDGLIEKINQLNIKTQIQLPQMPEKQKQRMIKNKFSQCLLEDGLFSYKVNNIKKTHQQTLDIGLAAEELDSIDKQALYFNLVVTEAKPEKLILRPVGEDNLNTLCRFLSGNCTISAISFRNSQDRWKDSNLNAVLHAIADSDMPLQELSLCWMDLQNEDVLALIRILKKHPIELLDLDFVKFKSISDPSLIALLGQTLAMCSSLIYLQCDNKLIDAGITQSTSLLVAKAGFLSKLKPEFKKVLEVNHEAFRLKQVTPAVEYKTEEPTQAAVSQELSDSKDKMARKSSEKPGFGCSLM